MIKYLGDKIRKVSFELSVRGEIATILKPVNFDSSKLNRGERAKLNRLVTLLDLSKNLM